MKKLVIFIADTDGGVATYIRSFLRYRPQAQLFVKLVIVQSGPVTQPLKAKDFLADEIVFFSFPDNENLYHTMKRMSRLVDSPQDIILCNERSELAMINLFRLPNPVLNIIHGDSAYYYDTVRRFKGIVDGFIATSGWIASQTNILLQNEKGRCRKLFAPVRDIPAESLPIELPLQIIYIGRLDTSKGVQHIPGICRLLDERRISYVITIVGNGDQLPDLRDASAGLKGSFIFRGFIANDNIPGELKGKHILLFPSYSEAVGIVIVEAMKGGLIPVVSDLPSGIPEFVLPGITGLTAPVGDEAAFAGQIAWLVDHPEKVTGLRANAVEISNRLFNGQQQAAGIQEYIENTGEISREKHFTKERYGFRLDSRFIPNRLTIFLRKLRRFHH